MPFDGTTLRLQPSDVSQDLDDPAFRRLWGQQRGRLLGLALRMTGTPTDAEDVVQEAFLQAWRARDRFAGQSQASTWLYRITANAALMHLRSRRRRPLELHSFLDGDDAVIVGLAGDAPGPEDVALVGERRDAVWQAVSLLPVRDRALLEAVLADRDDDGEGQGPVDLGSASARKSRLARARTRLRCDERLAAVI